MPSLQLLTAAFGTSRHFATAQQFGRFWSEADISHSARGGPFPAFCRTLTRLGPLATGTVFRRRGSTPSLPDSGNAGGHRAAQLWNGGCNGGRTALRLPKHHRSC